MGKRLNSYTISCKKISAGSSSVWSSSISKLGINKGWKGSGLEMQKLQNINLGETSEYLSTYLYWHYQITQRIETNPIILEIISLLKV